MGFERRLPIVLGAAVWIAVLAAIAASVHTLHAGTARDAEHLVVALESRCGLAPGDMVFVESDLGLVHIGEVSAAEVESNTTRISIRREEFARLNTSTSVTCWQTPLSVENAIEALLPPRIQRKAAEQIATDWQGRDEAVAAAWTPVLAELTTAYLQVIGEDVEEALVRHQDDLLLIAAAHGDRFSKEWPAIQRKLGPIVQQHLTPVLSRLVSAGLRDAPKLSIAWNVARGRNAEAYRLMLDWLADYLANMPEADKDRMGAAVRDAWDAARTDSDLRERFAALGDGIVNDPRLREVVEEIYTEAISANPRTAEFLKYEVLNSPELHKQMYSFIELFGPTARKVAAICLFDESGTTRPEVVHLVRSIALGRRVSWITLHTPDPEAPALVAGDEIPANRGETGS